MKNLLAILLLFSALTAAGQARPEITLDLIRQKDLSMLWTGPLPEIDRLDTTSLPWVDRPEPLGYIGKDFRRFRIHIAAIRRSGTDPLTYVLSGATLAKGKTKVSQAGENGLERHTIEVVYKNGVEVSRKTVKSEVVRKPVDQVTRIGTYEAPKATEKPKDDNKNTNKGDSKPAGSTDWGSVNAEGKLVSVPTISQIHTGNLYEHKKAPEPDASIIAKTVYIDHVTAYTWTGSPTATGVYPKMGTIAADPAKFPYGTKVYVPGYGYGRIEDTGGFRGKEHTQFDLYMDSEADCRTWGRKRNYKVYILK